MKRLILFAFLLCSFFISNAQYVLLISPNGGESFAIGSSQSISWASIGVNEIDIEYSSNNGASFTTIASNVSVFTNSYTWQVTGPATNDALIRIKESSSGVLTDVSAATFNVVNPSLLITYPTAALILNPAQQVNITWTGLIASNNVSLFFSTDNGVTYDTIVSNTPNFNNFDWIVPSVTSTTCKIKITDAAVPTVQNESPVFTIEALPSSGNILNPNGGENLFSTTLYNINWNVTGTNIINLDYSTNGGSTWNNIVQNLPASPGTYDWIVPSLNSNTVKVRLVNAINNLELDQSNNNFTITQPTPTLYLSSPFGFENWAVGSTQSIQWTYTFINSITIEYSTDGGVTFNLISANTPAADLSFDWTVPATLSTNCIIRIKDNSSITSSENQNPFSIVNPSITLFSPNGGEVFNSNVDTLITWNGNLISNLVKIEYTTNNGTSWNLITNNAPNSNSYQWAVPNTPSINCKVRISDAQVPAITDQSNAVFTITAPLPTITLLSPNGSEQWGIGTNQTIFWNSNNIANVKIEYSPDSGATWIILAASVPANTGSYTWLVNASPSNNVLIKVSNAANTSVNDISNNVLEFYTPVSFLDLLYPNGGEQVAAGLNATIIWNALNIGQIIIEYSINNGLSWQLVASGIDASLGSYNWEVPSVFSNSVKIRIRDQINIIFNDQTAGYFTIIEPSISFSSFPAGATYSIFSNLNLIWTSIGLDNQLVKLEYSVNNGINWVTFANGIANTGAYNWIINCIPTTSCKLRISVQNEPSINDTTQGGIEVISNGPAIVILTPQLSATIGAGTVYPITWYSYGVNYVRIEYSLNGDTIFQPITPFAPASSGLFFWNVPANINATNCKIKISNAANTNLSVETQFSFNIQPGQFFLTTGNIYSIYFSGTNYPITWTSAGNSGYVNLEYTLNNIDWINMVSNYPNTGYYNWVLPYINADSVWFRIQDYSNSNAFDINDMHQKIVINDSTLELISPNNGALILSDTLYLITWNSNGIDFIDIDFSEDNGITWNTIATNISAVSEAYLWTVPNIISNNALIRIKNTAYPSQFSQNQSAFTISNALLNITMPDGGEIWNTNNSHYIIWQTLGVDFVDIYYSIDGGATYTVIDTNVFNLGFYNWQTPITPGNNLKIKISASSDPSFSDESNANFSLINPVASITLNSPDGGEQIPANTGYYITWQATGISSINISYSLDGGVNYLPLANNISSSPAYYFWLVPDTFSVNCRIKITDASNSTLNDASSSNFTILDNSIQLQVIYPNGGESFNSASYQTIKWTAINAPFVKLYYSTNGGISYNYINSVYNDSAYIWNVPSIASNNCKIKVEDGNNASLSDVTNTLFSINNQPVSSNVILLDSLSNTNYCLGSTVPISFTTSGTFNSNNNFRVHLSDPFGTFNNFTDIGGIIAGTGGTIQCFFPQQLVSSNNYTLRIVSDNPVVISPDYPFGNIAINRANADFTSDKQLVVFPATTVNFIPNASSNATAGSNWNTGNAGNYTNFLAQHTYSAAGKYDIIHTLTDTSGCTNTSSATRLISVEHWFPNEIINTNTAEEIIDVAFENERYGCAILKNGNCLVTSDSGKTWLFNYTNSGNTLLNSIFILNNDWYITTDNGTYLKSTNKGVNWTQFSFNNNESLKDITFTSANNAYAVGNNGKLLKFNGTSWLNQNSNTSNGLNKIANKNNTTVVVGNDGTILKMQANNLWATMASPVNVNLNNIYLHDSLTGYIAADFGFILKTMDAGLTWNVVLSGADVNFAAIVGSVDSVWAVADDGIIYSSLDNGNSWNRFSVGVKDDLNSIAYINNTGYLVGNNGLLRKFNNPKLAPEVIDAIKENKREFIVNCFPNPTANTVNLSFSNNQFKTLNISMTDINGKVVFENKSISNSPQLYSIDLKAIPDGIYFITVNADALHQTFKVIKTN